LNTGLGRWLTTPHAYLSMARPSPYVAKHQHPGQEGTRDRVEPLGNRKYLFIYPFLKTPEWYFLPPAERQRMMKQHIEVGHKYPTVKNNTTYSYGLDDQEFVVAFESDKPEDFLQLVEEMRGIETRRYTLRDTPIFTCIRRPLKECLDALG
ncbi:MAG: chlorite dismutase family protein, partial [Euryarchaeota archaeon]|nr:chlorite dismutase family protein [Euryarchaeota archaeon]